MFESAKTFLRSLHKNAQGNVMTLMGLSMVPLVGTVGLAVDGAQWITWKRELRSAADAGAIAGANSLKNGGTGDEVKAAVRKVLGYNTQRTYTINAIESPPTVGQFAGDKSTVRVVLSTSQSLPFSSMFMRVAPTISVEAVAQASNEVVNCMIALSTTGSALSITGSASVDMNCGLASNSDFDATSSDTIRAGALSAVGTVTEGNNITSDTAVNNGSASATDPFAGQFSDPSQVCSGWPLISGPSNSLSPGCYKGIQVQSNAKLTLSPGTYYLGEKGLSVGGNATVTGDGVTLIFTNTSSPFNSSKIGTFSAQGTSTIKLTAPDTGTYAGIIIFQDSRTPLGNGTNGGFSVTGDSGSVFDGAIYAPSTQVTFTGNSGMTTDCLQIISQYISFSGNTSVANSCPSGRGVVSFNGSEYLRMRL
ncbi:MAG: pilus assembly protein TadG-related protein [Erythrobacter sp.]